MSRLDKGTYVPIRVFPALITYISINFCTSRVHYFIMGTYIGLSSQIISHSAPKNSLIDVTLYPGETFYSYKTLEEDGHD